MVTNASRKTKNSSDAELTPAATIDELKQFLADGPVMGIGSPRASLESNYMLRELVGADNFLQWHQRQ